MDIFNTYATDEAAEIDGKWFPLSKTAKVKVARTGNPKYLSLLRKRLGDAQVDLASGTAETESVADLVIASVLAETILLDWEGLTFKGVPMKYSIDNAKKLLAIKDFRKKVASYADSFEAFRAKGEADQGNA